MEDLSNTGRRPSAKQNPETRRNSIPPRISTGVSWTSLLPEELNRSKVSEWVNITYDAISKKSPKKQNKLANESDPEIPTTRIEIILFPTIRLNRDATFSARTLNRVFVVSPIALLRSSIRIHNSAIRLTHKPSVDSFITKVKENRYKPSRPAKAYKIIIHLF